MGQAGVLRQELPKFQDKGILVLFSVFLLYPSVSQILL